VHNNFSVTENRATRSNVKMANKNLILVAVSLLALFAVAAVPADASWYLNFTVQAPNGTALGGAMINMSVPGDRNTLPAQNNSITDTATAELGRANLIMHDDSTALWGLKIVAQTVAHLDRNRLGFKNLVSVPFPTLPKAAYLGLVLNTTNIKLMNALTIRMIAYNSTARNATLFYANRSIMLNGTADRFGVTLTNNTDGSADGGGAVTIGAVGTSYSYIILDRDKGIPVAYSINATARAAGQPADDFSGGQISEEVLPLQKNYTVIFFSKTGESPPRATDIINPATNTSLNITPAAGGVALTAAASNLDNMTFVYGIAQNFTTTYVNVNGSIFVPMLGNGTGGPSGAGEGSNYGGNGHNYVTISNITAIPYINSFAFVKGYLRGTSPTAPIVWTASVATTNTTIAGLNYSIWNWNISLPTQTSWIILASASNSSNRTGNLATSRTYLLGLTNVTVGAVPVDGINFTMKPVYSYSLSGGVFMATNVSNTGNGSNSPPVDLNMTQLQIVDGDNNNTLTGISYVVIELNTNNSQRSGAFNNWTAQMIKVKFAMETSSVGRVAFPFFVNESAKVTVYTGRQAPKEFVLTPDMLAANETINLTVYSYRPRVPGTAGDGIGGYKVDAFIENLEVSILGNNATCNLLSVNIPAGCILSQVTQPQDVNPLAGLFQGQKVSVRIRSLDKGHIIHYFGVDMGGGGVPEVQFDPVAEDRSGSRTDLVFKFGARLPKNTYDGIFVAMPYGATVEEAEDINVSISELYDTNWNPVWNVTLNGTPLNEAVAGKFNSTDFTDWNLSMIANRSLGGVVCSKTNGGPGFACLANTTENMVWIRVPHFSGGGLGVNGVRAASTSTASSGTSGGGGSGGGGGGAVGGTSQSFVSTTVTAQAPVSNDVTKSEIGITQVEYTLSENANNVKLEVNKLADKPAEIASSPSGTAYGYISIKLSNVADSAVASGKIKFTVDKSWVTENSADVSSVKLNRWDGNAWNALSTSYTGETDTAYTYEATTPGFSTFAITATTRAGPAAATPSTPAGTPTTPSAASRAVTPTAGGNTAMWIIVAIIVIAVVVGLAMKGKGKKRWY
jgi:PGF-pre-PGF domain-containing protein